VKLRKIENALDLTWAELRARCIAVMCADGLTYKPVFGHDEDGFTYVSIQEHELTRVFFGTLPLMGWTFYEEEKPLVWEGECEVTANRCAFYIDAAPHLLPEGLAFKKFRVVATKIVEGKDAEA
jgi:hypothetical protein